MLWLLYCQRLLVERNKTDIVPELVSLIQNKNVDAIVNTAAIHALGVLEGIGQLDGSRPEITQVCVAARHLLVNASLHNFFHTLLRLRPSLPRRRFAIPICRCEWPRRPLSDASPSEISAIQFLMR